MWSAFQWVMTFSGGMGGGPDIMALRTYFEPGYPGQHLSPSEGRFIRRMMPWIVGEDAAARERHRKKLERVAS